MDEVRETIEESWSELRETFKTGRTRSVNWRKNQLRALTELLHDHEEDIFSALYQDLGKPRVEAYRDEIGVIGRSTSLALRSLDQWVAPKKSSLPLLFFPATGKVIPEPFGTVLIFSCWNFPISLALDPLIGAISAGNTVLLKTSELSPRCSSFLAQKIPLYLDSKAVKVVQGEASVSQILLQHRWDKIFFTGSPKVGRIIMSAAAEHLTPVTLELGGKCPTILDHLSNPRDFKVAVKRIAGGKWGCCSGQACIGIDYILVEKRFATALIDMLKKSINKCYGENPKNSNALSRIVNKHHFQRIARLLDDPRVDASIVHGGFRNEETLTIEPTILLDPPLDSDIMSEEIFGPILPIITLRNIEESIEFINSRPKPLTIYAFTKNQTLKTRILTETSSGGVAFNDVMVQFLCDALPFGGVGQSGMGRYHGKYSFECFSHEKAVLEGSFFPEIEPRYPPWNNFKFRFLRLAYCSDYFNLLLLLLGFRR